MVEFRTWSWKGAGLGTIRDSVVCNKWTQEGNLLKDKSNSRNQRNRFLKGGNQSHSRDQESGNQWKAPWGTLAA